MPLNEKRRLLRHVQPYWDTHRHRMPPEAADVIDHLQDVGQLIIRRGCIQGFELHDEAVHVNIETQCQAWTLDVQHVINCTGPNSNYSTLNDPLMMKLIQRRLAQPDYLKLGLDADRNGALRNAFGTASTTLYTIGSPLKGILWETTAVPEIRQQASRLANILLASLTVSEPVLTESY